MKSTMTPTQYVKANKPYLTDGGANGKVMSARLFNKLDKAWRTFTHSQQTFCRMALIGPDKATKVIRQQKRKGTQ